MRQVILTSRVCRLFGMRKGQMWHIFNIHIYFAHCRKPRHTTTDPSRCTLVAIWHGKRPFENHSKIFHQTCSHLNVPLTRPHHRQSVYNEPNTRDSHFKYAYPTLHFFPLNFDFLVIFLQNNSFEYISHLFRFIFNRTITSYKRKNHS
jgi:hypothetical protein